MQGPHPYWKLLGVFFNNFDDYPRHIYLGVPPKRNRLRLGVFVLEGGHFIFIYVNFTLLKQCLPFLH